LAPRLDYASRRSTEIARRSGRPGYEDIEETGAAYRRRVTLKVRCQLDQNTYPAGIKVSDAEIEAINITRHDFHGEWNYTIRPNLSVPKR
jgi:hypothetical protein